MEKQSYILNKFCYKLIIVVFKRQVYIGLLYYDFYFSIYLKIFLMKSLINKSVLSDFRDKVEDK